MQATITKQFTFHAAHQLPNHEGPCRRLHGHTYRLEVIVTGRIKDLDGSSDEGMVLDFAELKRVYGAHIEPRVEHQFLNETLDMPVPTSENIAAWIHRQIKQGLNRDIGDAQRLTSLCVRLWESPTSYAEVGRAPWRG